MSRTSPHQGRTALSHPGSIKLVYDAELMELTCSENFALCCTCPCFCPTYNRRRSYLYIRENSLESNIAVNYCGSIGEKFNLFHDSTTVQYFDKPPYETSTCVSIKCQPCWFHPLLAFLQCAIPLYGPGKPKPEVQKMGCQCCCQYVDPCCCGERVVIMPFENYCFCCSNRVGCCDNLGGLFGPPTGNPKLFTPFLPQPLNPTEFCKIAQQTMFDREGTDHTSLVQSQRVGVELHEVVVAPMHNNKGNNQKSVYAPLHA
jgi:hypothetical protein